MARQSSTMADRWQAYWFRPWPVLDLAILRLLAVGTQLWLLAVDPRYGRQALADLAAMPDSYYHPLPFLQLILLPFGGAEPSLALLETLHLVAVVAGFLALIGLFTNVSLGIFAGCALVLQLWMVSHSDIHHPEAVMMISLCVLALAPAGRRLSIDSIITGRSRRGGPRPGLLDEKSEFAGWPILVVQWIFALMYASAAYSKIVIGGLDWPNGFTLQYYLAGQGLENGAPLGVWLSQFHYFVLASQWGVLLFQLTFFLSMLFPQLKWVYVPAGMFMHVAIYWLLAAPFFQWMALYAAFIPWTGIFRWIRAQRVEAPTRGTIAPGLEGAVAGQ